MYGKVQYDQKNAVINIDLKVIYGIGIEMKYLEIMKNGIMEHLKKQEVP